jgi:dTMP kinase
MKGKLIVIDGIDGSGKTTQIDLLSRYLKQKKIPFEIISYPQYGKNEYAIQIKKYLEGMLGGILQTDSYNIAKLYANDRLTVKGLIKKWLDSGKLVICNRYVSSSKAHLGANLPEHDRKNFIKWVDQLEYRTNKLPRENLVIFLKVLPKIGQRNAQLNFEKDIHEQDLRHEITAAKIYLELSKIEKNWIVINCMKNNKLKDVLSIHKEILIILNRVW